jgi:formamidopyrimidine-DNA glycosylase
VMLHLGMSGSLRILPLSTAPGKHDHIDIELDDQRLLRFRDPRRFGSVFWLAGERSHPLLDDLGPEPLEPAFSAEHLHHVSKGRRAPVKQVVMNSHVVVGVGNIYANEALFMAGIRPARLAGKISLPGHRRLVAAIKEVLSQAIAAGGTTLRDFVHEDGSPGYFRQELRVYGRGGEPCITCRKPLSETRLGGRTTVFCTACQR